MPAYALTIFLGAFLLFQVQPLMGKYILPWFGGGPGVWTVCMLFFQVLLLCGYAYAHSLTRWAGAKAQAVVHLGLLLLALVLLPIIPGESWKPQGTENPNLYILALLTRYVGLPYFVLSATGPLMQQWFSRAYSGRSPYRLYSLSNAGSLLALLSFPLLFEPHLTRKDQASLWGWGLLLYAVCCAGCAWLLLRRGKEPEAAPQQPIAAPEPKPGVRPAVLWVLLPACASVLLLGVTNKLCQDVAVIPFLWIVPLALYLLTFIITFDHQRWYRRGPFGIALVLALAGLCLALVKSSDWPVWQQVTVYSTALFVCCMVCHGELYRLRPAPVRLTSFYLAIAAGGALGGVFVALLAPMLFTNYYELHWGMFITGALFVWICATERPVPGPAPIPHAERTEKPEVQQPVPHLPAWRTSEWPWLACSLPLLTFGGLDYFIYHFGPQAKALPPLLMKTARIGLWAFVVLMAVTWFIRSRRRPFRHWRLLACLWLSLGLAALGITLASLSRKNNPDRTFSSRNFYGVLSVYDYRKNDPENRYFLLQHGRITHGIQFADPEQAKWPTSYYSPESGVALALNAELPRSRRVGVVGLGTGTLAALARPGDHMRFYEINPQVLQLAHSPFTYLTNCAGKVEVVLGDARLSMEREQPQNFDLLALDAFSSDSIPVHLLTREAFALYQRHLTTNGVIAVHISNHYLDLEPVVANLAREFHYRMAVIDYDETIEDWWLYSSTWVLLSRDEHLMASPEIATAAASERKSLRSVPLWTDDFVSLFQILK